VEADLGTSALRCDLAVRRPGDTEHRLAVLLDHRPADAGVPGPANDHERYIDRPRALASTGWDTTHVLAKDWLASPPAVVERIRRRLEGHLEPVETPDDPPPLRSATGRRRPPRVAVAVAATAAAAAAVELPTPGAGRRFNYVAGPSSKFWQISRTGNIVFVTFGRIGTSGQTQMKDLGSEEAAEAYVKRLIGEKTRKGYAEE
jgi:predicted DNA-binding WGR domain protein